MGLRDRETEKPGDRETGRPGDRETGRPGDRDEYCPHVKLYVYNCFSYVEQI